MARLIRNPFSLRQCKCLFVSVLLVCAVMVLVALKLHPELVKASFHLEASSNSLVREKSQNSNKYVADQPSDGDTEWTDSVQFLPHTDSPATRPDGDQSVVKGNEALVTQDLEKIINSGPIYYHNKVPSYVPDGSAVRGNKDMTLYCLEISIKASTSQVIYRQM